AVIYVNDTHCEDTKVAHKKYKLIALYDTKLVDPCSKFSYNLMRYAVSDGNLWLVKLLIGYGVPIKNLPKYGTWDDDIESQQLLEILRYPVPPSWEYGKLYILTLNNRRKAV